MISCVDEGLLDNAGFLRAFHRKVHQLRVPLHGGIDLTYRCNLRCIHCYGGPASAAEGEMETGQVISIVDQAVESGCLFFLISGGEPLVRDDFAEIYRYVKQKGLFVTLFTNGTLIDDDTIALFKELPPRTVGITFYGATADTHEKITGVSGSFEKALDGLKRLVRIGIDVEFKTILMSLNSGEFHEMERLAGSLGARFRMDPAIFAKFDGDTSPLALRVAPREAIDRELSDNRRVKSWLRYAGRVNPAAHDDALFSCGAGRNSFHVDAYGNLLPCAMAREISYSMADGGLEKGWREVIPRIRAIRSGPGLKCGACSIRGFCNFCPGCFRLERESESSYHQYVCELAKERARRLEENVCEPAK